MTLTNNRNQAIYEINPVLPGNFYDWNTKNILKEG